MRSEPLEDQVRRNFEQDIWHKKDDQSDIVLIASKVELLREAVDVGVGNVDSIQEGLNTLLAYLLERGVRFWFYLPAGTLYRDMLVMVSLVARVVIVRLS